MKRICPVTACEEVIPPFDLMCLCHWRQVPRELQANIFRAFKRGPGSEEHLEACRAAVEAAGKDCDGS